MVNICPALSSTLLQRTGRYRMYSGQLTTQVCWAFTSITSVASGSSEIPKTRLLPAPVSGVSCEESNPVATSGSEGRPKPADSTVTVVLTGAEPCCAA